MPAVRSRPHRMRACPAGGRLADRRHRDSG